MIFNFCINLLTSKHIIPQEQAHGYFKRKTLTPLSTWLEWMDGEAKTIFLFQIQKIFEKTIQPICLPDSATLEEHYFTFFHSSTNALSSCVKLFVQIMFIQIDSHDTKEDNLSNRDFITQTGIPHDVDVIIFYQAKELQIGATIQLKIQVKANL